MHYTQEQLILIFTFFPILMAVILAALKVKVVNQPLRILCWLIFFALATECVGRVLWLLKTSNLFLWPIYITVSFSLILWMYSIVLANRFLTRIRLVLQIAFLGLIMLRVWTGSSQGVIIDNLGLLVESGVVIGLALAYYVKVFQEVKIQALWLEPFFWVSTGLFLFYTGNFLIFIFINYILLYSSKLNTQVWVVHALLNYLLYGIYTIALWISPRK